MIDAVMDDRRSTVDDGRWTMDGKGQSVSADSHTFTLSVRQRITLSTIQTTDRTCVPIVNRLSSHTADFRSASIVHRLSSIVILRAIGILVLIAVLGTLAYAAPDKIQVATELSTRNVRTEESKLADIVADAVQRVEGSDI